MKNPVMPASGTFGYGEEYAAIFDLNILGAIVVKGISLKPVMGNPTPRLVETPSGLLNAIGLQNPGFELFARDYMPFLRQYDIPVIVNIWGHDLKEYIEVVKRFNDVPGVHGLELNVSCPNIKEGGISFGANPRLMERVVASARAATDLPLIVKLPPHLFNIGEYAKLCEDSGADVLAITNSLPGMLVDPETRRPILANKTGGVTGPAIHPIALKLVWDAAKATRLPIIGMGGITSAKEALAFIIAGASAVAVGTANFTEPDTIPRVIRGIEEYLKKHDIQDIAALRGTLTIA